MHILVMRTDHDTIWIKNASRSYINAGGQGGALTPGLLGTFTYVPDMDPGMNPDMVILSFKILNLQSRQKWLV